MQKLRTRPTREETRGRIFAAAVQVFEHYGIGAASIDMIADCAGLTRGAFYSNFLDKDDLIIAILDDHATHTVSFHTGLLKRNTDPAQIVDEMGSLKGREHDPLAHAELVHLELILYVARATKYRPQLAKRLKVRRELVANMARATGIAAALGMEPEKAGAALLAMLEGFRVHRLVDPKTTPADSFLSALSAIQKATARKRVSVPAGAA